MAKAIKTGAIDDWISNRLTSIRINTAKGLKAIKTGASLTTRAPDVIMPRTRRESLRNKIAELSNSGLNSNEIADYLKKVSKGELIRIIRDYQEV